MGLYEIKIIYVLQHNDTLYLFDNFIVKLKKDLIRIRNKRF